MPYFLHEYVDYPNGPYHSDNGFWQIDGDKLLNPFGGWHCYRPKPTDEIVEAESWADLPSIEDQLVDNTQKSGWVSPDGIFYGCAFFCHEKVADLVLHRTEEELENSGWVKIFRSSHPWAAVKTEYDWYKVGRLTKAQQDTLMEKGFQFKE